MQLGRSISIPALALGLTLVSSVQSHAFVNLQAQSVDYLLQYFSDSDDVSVRSLVGNFSADLNRSTALNVQWNNELVVIPAIEAPIGSQDAVDAITTASRPISGNAYEDFIKTRNEFTGELRHKTTTLGFYVSSEVDYLAQQVGLSHNRDFDNQLLNISVGASYGWDNIMPLADDDNGITSGRKTTLHGNIVATRILSPRLLLRVGVEYNIVDGIQHNPYRNVYAGGTNVPEAHPDHRTRRDVFVKLNTYLGNRSSARLSYRLYNDSWGIGSQEMSAQLSQYVTHGLFASYRYRFYTQGAADFYSDDYASITGLNGYLTGDFRMSEMNSHLMSFLLDFDMNGLAPDSRILRKMGFQVNYERYFNSLNYSANILTTQIVYRF